MKFNALTKAKLHTGIGALVASLLAVAAALSPSEPAQALNISFPQMPAGGVSGAAFNFSVTVDVASAEYAQIQSVGLYIRKTNSPPLCQAVCANLPLNTGARSYTEAETGGGGVSVIATAGTGWENVPGYGYGPGPISLTYDVVWYVPGGWLAGPCQVEVRLYTSDRTIVQTGSLSLSVRATLGATSTSQYTNAAGLFVQNFAAAATDGRARVSILAGTKGLINREPLSEIAVIPVATPPPAPTNATVIASYSCGPEQATFDPSANVSMMYDLAALPAGVDEKNLVMAVFDAVAGKWSTLTSSVDLAGDVVTAPATRFGTFGILAYTRPAAFTVSDLSITPVAAEVGKAVTVAVTVNNTGDLSGSYTVALRVNDVPTTSRDLSQAGKTSQKVTFSTSANATGTYSVDVNGCIGTFDARPAATPPPRPTPTRKAVPPPAPASTGAPKVTSAPTLTPTAATPAKPPEPAASWPDWLPYAGMIAIGAVFGFALWKTVTSH